MTLRREFLVLLMLGASSACPAADVKPSPSEARPSMPFSGTAIMQDDGAITLHLRLTSDGKDIDDSLTYKTTDRGYDDIVRHLGGLNPGETKSFSPWKD
ncbi:hypothetical protein [Bradyrhizobium sp. dw_78]|uniref:hypothetical protein n=1 Tax=Bradyrhizobium sp. dw_78 TaxID=2719793 RepID=UPI001BD36D52|nr:hypothetical protein [Bradyrhizobium sp. dw_78]